ncbi:MAG: CCA tRNA nucleotidyltransferase [Candidatus Methanomethylicia archaeon]
MLGNFTINNSHRKSKLEEMSTLNILREVLEKITPSTSERLKVSRIINEVKQRILKKAYEYGINVEISVEGSIAKDTWLSNDKDIDVFIHLPKELGNESLKTVGLEICKSACENWIEAYAEHPYIQANMNGFKVDIVPVFKINSIDEAETAVARTPFHTRFINSKFNNYMRKEVRILKQFMKGTGVYGAEIKVRGFSGYLCELLIYKYKSFTNLLENTSKWKPYHVVIDPARHYSNLNEVKKIFVDPLIVIDPVDKKRNVAAALSIDKMSRFIAASRAFKENPSLKFFFPTIDRITKNEMIKIRKKGFKTLFIILKCPKLAPDILWGEIFKSLEGLSTLLEKYDFKVLSKDAWSDEKNVVVLAFQLESMKIPRIKKHIGPPISLCESEKNFLKKNILSRDVVSGPCIERDRWVIYKLRSITKADDLIRNKFMEAKHGPHIKTQNFEVVIDEKILDKIDTDDFRIFLKKFMSKKENWI